MPKLSFVVSLLVLLCACMAGCGGGGVFVSRGTTVNPRLAEKDSGELAEYFKAVSVSDFGDGSKLTASFLMRDLSYIKASGSLSGKGSEEVKQIASFLRFSAEITYTTPYIFTGEEAASPIDMENWIITLRDSVGNEERPSVVKFEKPMRKIGSMVTKTEPAYHPFAGVGIVASEAVALNIYQYEGYLIFDYRVPEGCSWMEIKLKVPQTGDWVIVKWNIRN